MARETTWLANHARAVDARAKEAQRELEAAEQYDRDRAALDAKYARTRLARQPAVVVEAAKLKPAAPVEPKPAPWGEPAKKSKR